MATLTLYEALPDDQSLEAYFSAFMSVGIPAPKYSNLYGSNANELAMQLRSKGFDYNKDNTAIVDGTVKNAKFYGDPSIENFQLVAKMEDVNFDFGNYQYTPPVNGQSLIMLFLRGSDIITGSKDADVIHGYEGKDVIRGGGGDDFIYGGSGKDTLSGGAGSDRFYIGKEFGADVIKDFDADDTDGKQDFLYVSAGTIIEDYHKAGKNVVVSIENGPDITLLNVKAAQFNESDLVFL